MKREEAIKWFIRMKETPFVPLPQGAKEAIDMALSALSVLEQIRWERDVALATLEEHGIGLGQKAEEYENYEHASLVDIKEPLKSKLEVDAAPKIDHDRDWIIGCIQHDGFIHTHRFDKANRIILEALEQTDTDLISRAEAIERIANDNLIGGIEKIHEYRNANHNDHYIEGLSDAIATLEDMPNVPSADRPITTGCIADNIEVPPYTTTSAVSAERVGEWEFCKDEDGVYGICSVCGVDADFSHYGKPYTYCPNCGAKMKGGTD